MTTYRIDETKIQKDRITVRCPKCKGLIEVEKPIQMTLADPIQTTSVNPNNLASSNQFDKANSMYIYKNLMPGEKLICRANIHWARHLLPAIVIVIGFVIAIVGFMGSSEVPLAIGLLSLVLTVAFGVLLFLVGFSFEFGVTNRRVFWIHGLIRKDWKEILLTKVESIQVHETLLGRSLGYTHMSLSGTGGSKIQFAFIPNHSRFRKRTEEQIGIAQGSRLGNAIQDTPFSPPAS